MIAAARALVALLAFAPAAGAFASAQERGTLAERGGVVAVVSEGWELDANARQRLFELATGSSQASGARVTVRIAPKDATERAGALPTEPLAQSPLTRVAFDVDLASAFPGDIPGVQQRIELARPHGAVDSTSAASADRVRAIELVGGTWSNWWTTLTPLNRSSSLANVLREAHRRGTPLVAAGCASGHLFDYAVEARAAVRPRSRNAHPDDPTFALTGLGLVEGAFDESSRSGGSLQRLARAALRTDLGPAHFLAGKGAWIVAPARGSGGEAELAGESDAALLVLDLAGPARARRMRESIREARLSLLRPGARWDLARRTFAASMKGLERTRVAATDLERRVDDALAATELVRAIDELAQGTARRVTLRSARSTVELASDELTQRAERSCALVRIDVLWEYGAGGR